MSQHTTSPSIKVQLIGGPTTLIEIGGLRLVTDPTFDPPGSYNLGGRTLIKRTGPAVSPYEIGPVDAVLLSHDQHVDNLDRLGRQWITSIPVVLTTSAGSTRVPGTTALPNWTHVVLQSPDGKALRITGVPAQHGPDNTEHVVGEVTGFVLEGDHLPTVYVSGDNASTRVVESIAKRFPSIDIAILFCGAARSPLLGEHNLTLGSEEAATAAKIIGARVVIPVHFEGWAHFTEGAESVRNAFEAQNLQHYLHLIAPGECFIS